MNDPNGHWVKLDKDIVNAPYYTDPHWLQVYIYLLAHAAWRPCKTKFDGGVITLEPGQLVSGRKRMSNSLGISQSNIYRTLKRLESEQRIEQRSCSTSTLITVTSINRAWKSEQPFEQQMDSGWTASEQRVNTIKDNRSIDKKIPTTPVKAIGGSKRRGEDPSATASGWWFSEIIPDNVTVLPEDDPVSSMPLGDAERPGKRDKPIKSAPCRETLQTQFDAFWVAYPRKVGKAAALRAFSKAIKATSLEALLRALTWQRSQPQWTKDGGQYIPHPATWLNQGRWADEPALTPGAAAQLESAPAVSMAGVPIRPVVIKAKPAAEVK